MDILADGGMLQAAGHAFVAIMQWDRLLFLWLGVLVGLLIGLLPGIGGLTGFALLVPFTYAMDPISALAMLLGMAAVVNTSDTIPAVLFGVPGTAASQATVLDGLQMTKRGEAGRALSAAYTASMIGGLIGAAILALSLPVVRPLVLSIGTPELLAMTIFGIAMVSTLSGKTPLRGLVAGCFGILLGMIGTNVQTGQMRWTMDMMYLREGLPMLPVLLGLFALPELCDLAIKRGAVATSAASGVNTGVWQGVKDTFQNKFLVLRCSGIGALIGAIPGITSAVTDWIVYGHALRSEKGASKTFGTGDVRGVIAPESATNATNGGSLVPMLSFGVPGGAAQAILLGAMMVHGFIPGPDMLTRHLDVTYTMIWSIALANIFGAGLCFALSSQFARIAMLRYTLILPLIISLTFVGAYQGSNSWGDMIVLILFGLLGWAMKRLGWPRPPLILGLVLGVLLERYLSISMLRFGSDWLSRPLVIVLLVCSAWVLAGPLIRNVWRSGPRAMLPSGSFAPKPSHLMYVFFLSIAAWMLIEAQGWYFNARVGPTFAASILLIAGLLSLVYNIFSGRRMQEEGIYMDLASSDESSMDVATIMRRAVKFFGWYAGFLCGTLLIGILPTIPIVVIAFMRNENREPWKLCIGMAAGSMALIYVVFDRIISIAWPHSLLGEWFPLLRDLIPSM